MDKDFETQVLTRLAVIESKIDDYKSVKEKTDLAYNLSKDNEKKLDKIEEKNNWLFKTSIGAIITSLIGIGFTLFKNGLGIG